MNLSHNGALLASRNRMSPGARTELQLLGTRRRSVRGRIERCRVTALDPVCYEGVVLFDEQLEWRDAPTG